MKFQQELIIFFIAIATAGVLLWLKRDKEQQSKQLDERLKAEVIRVNSAVPYSKTYNLENGTITVLNIPYTSELTGNLIEVQRCFVWRDFSGSTTMSCPSQPEISLTD